MSDVKKLNKEQASAAEHVDGPMLVVAGAGTGKTTILVERLKYLVENKKARGDEVLLLTFTEKGAGEMDERAMEVLPYGYFDLWISTFHGFSERILREHALDIGLSPDFRILSTTEQWILIKKNIDRFKLDYYKPLGNPNKFIYELVKHFSKLKDEYIEPTDYVKYTKENEDPDKEESTRLDELSRAYKVYNEILLENGFLDFGDLIFYTIKLFETRPRILEFYREKFKYTMIDEFQDTNWSQYALIKLLTSPTNNLMVVGDDDQSIYKFRGASLSNILQFKDDYDNAKEVVLTQNYRSGQEILDTAYNFIQHNNPNRLEERINLDKTLTSGLGLHSEVTHLNFSNLLNEQEWVAKEIIKLKEEDPESTWKDFAILVRANSTADAYVDELKRKKIPNTFVSLRGLYYKEIILDCVAYLRLLDHYHESSALFRVLNMEVFRVDHKTLVNITRYARRKQWSLFEALNKLSLIPGVGTKDKENIGFLLSLIKKHSALVQKEPSSRLFATFVHDAGLDDKEYHENKEYFSYLNQFYAKMTNFERDMPGTRLKDFMDLLDLEIESGETGSLRLDFEDSDTVSIMTVHSSKGLEFKYVFIVNLVDKKFPSISRKEKITIPDELLKEKITDSKDAHIEEERRLFYVALTRAKKKLYLSSAKDCGGVREKKPSAFIGEIDITSQEIGEDTASGNILLRDISNMNAAQVTKKIDFELPKRFSFSQIEAFSNCPLQYKYSFILKIPTLSKPVFIFGRLMHNTLKDFMSVFIQAKQASMFEAEDNTRKIAPTEADIMKIYESYWSDDGYETKEQREEYKQEGKNMLRLYFKKYSQVDWPNVEFTEKPFVHKLASFFFRGSIDRVDRLADGTLELIDYKTGTPKEKIGYKEKRQLILYKLAVEEGMGEKVSKLSFIYLKDGSTVSFESKPKDEEKLISEISASIEEMKKGKFDAKPGFLCDYCDFNNICEFRKVN